MDPKALHKKLQELWDTRGSLEKHGPDSKPGAEWLAEARAHIELADPNLAVEFAHFMSLVGLHLSSYTLGPIWINMQGILRTAVSRVEVTIPPTQEKIYGPGDAIDVYRDVSQIVAAATSSVFIADVYGDLEIFDLYLAKVGARVSVRLLTKSPSGALQALAAKFSARPGVQFEARSTSGIHDRVIFIDGRDCWVIGQSIKDAAMKKPTYLLPVAAVLEMSRLYEDAWNSASPY